MNNFTNEIMKLQKSLELHNVFLNDFENFKIFINEKDYDFYNFDKIKNKFKHSDNNRSITVNKEILYTYLLMFDFLINDRNNDIKSCYSVFLPRKANNMAIDTYIQNVYSGKSFGVQVKTSIPVGVDELKIENYKDRLDLFIEDFLFVSEEEKVRENEYKSSFPIVYIHLEEILKNIDLHKEIYKDIYLCKEFLVYLILKNTSYKKVTNNILVKRFMDTYFGKYTICK